MPFFVVCNYSNVVARLPDLELHLYNSNIVYPPLSTVASPERFPVWIPPGFWLSVFPFDPSTSGKLLTNTHLLLHPLPTKASINCVHPSFLHFHESSPLAAHLYHFLITPLRFHQLRKSTSEVE